MFSLSLSLPLSPRLSPSLSFYCCSTFINARLDLCCDVKKLKIIRYFFLIIIVMDVNIFLLMIIDMQSRFDQVIHKN